MCRWLDESFSEIGNCGKGSCLGGRSKFAFDMLEHSRGFFRVGEWICMSRAMKGGLG